MLTIVADENIPLLDQFFSDIGSITRVNGRSMFAEQVVDADILLVRSVTHVNEALLANSTVRFVGTATIGIDHLDTDYLETKGIVWANAPGCNANSVVDYVFSCFCQVDNLWQQLFDNFTVGIIGLGNVGSCLQDRLNRLNIATKGYDPLLPESNLNTHDLSSVMSCDVLCLHAPLTKTGSYPSFHMIAESELALLKPGAVLVSAGRGAVIDNGALEVFLEGRPDVITMLDVWEGEPNIAMGLLPQVKIATPHIAGYSLDGKTLGTNMIYQACCDSLKLVSAEKIKGDQYFEIEVPESLSAVEAFCFTMAHVYDVSTDDQCFRESMLAADDMQRAKRFDELRKFYPERREFSRYIITNSQCLPAQLNDWLKAAGFHLS
ncbi:MAG: erythronate-4-phosphate dehydrogenase [Pseudohongiellaceae bacterium]